MSLDINPRNIVFQKLKSLIEKNNSNVPKVKKLKEEDINTLTTNVEKGIYNRTIEFSIWSS